MLPARLICTVPNRTRDHSYHYNKCHSQSFHHQGFRLIKPLLAETNRTIMNPELEAIEIGIACAKQAAPEAAAATESFLSEMWGKIFSSRKACNSVATSIAKTAEEAGAPKVRIPCIHPATDSPSRIFPDAYSANSTEAKLYEKTSGAVVK